MKCSLSVCIPLLQESRSSSSSGRELRGTGDLRSARKLYIGGLSGDVTEAELEDLFNNVIQRALGEPPNTTIKHVVSVYVNHRRLFGFIELDSVPLTTACIRLNGLLRCHNQPLKIRRPSDFRPDTIPPAEASRPLPLLDLSAAGLLDTNGESVGATNRSSSSGNNIIRFDLFPCNWNKNVC